MALVVPSLLSLDQLESLQALPEVQEAYQKLSPNSQVSFQIPLSDLLRNALAAAFSLQLSGLSTIPCRWIQGDTPAHKDRGQTSFDKTYLIYLTNGEGTFQIGDISYPIEAGTGFSFEEGTKHEVTGTNGSSRLLLGPMSETGFAVGAGTILEGGGGTFAYLRDTAGTTEYSYDQSTWYTVSFPCGVENTNTSAGYFQVIFTTNLVFNSTTQYFYLLSEKVQFGSTSANSDGSRPSITISIDTYGGLIENGTSATSGYNDIRVYNLTLNGSGYTTATGGGWVGRGYYGNAASGCFFINCTSSGDIAQDGGGIVGYYAGTSGGSLTILGCSSTGDMAVGAGGITGGNCDGITCTQCFSEGALGQNAGGIVGVSAGGGCSASKCYSTGAMGLGAGGIFGGSAATGCSASQSYSTGTIGTSAGGIFGNFAATTTASNCYSTGTIGTSAGGIFGNPFGNPGTRTATNCYSANGSWNTSTANTNLQGVPTGAPGVGTVWASTATNTAYELADFGATPYQSQTISGTALVQSVSQSVNQGSSSSEALNADASGNSFAILQTTGGDSGSYASITISAQTGAISTTAATAVGIYTLRIRSTGSYYITTFVLTVTAYVPPVSSSSSTDQSCCVSTMDQRGLEYEQIMDYRIGNRLILQERQTPNQTFDGYSEFVKYKIAKGSRKI